MKTVNKIGLSLIIGCTMLVSTTATMAASHQPIAYGADSLTDKQVYTIEEMLRYAIEDEYLARAEYLEIMEQFGEVRPFTNIAKAEQTHISMLEPLFAAYNIALPENDAKQHLSIADSLETAYKLGVEAEIKNIDMYERFLSQELPDDVRAVFEYLVRASNNHLNAFQRQVDRANGSFNQQSDRTSGQRGGKGRNNQ